jgi:membrane fusion protein, multidrug efflux system
MDQVERRTTDAPSQEPANPIQKPARPPFWTRLPVIVLGTAVLGLMLFFGLVYLVDSLTHESTDDAFLDADFASVAPRVSGQVKQVYVGSNQKVSADDLLLEIDPRDLQVQVDQKQAALKAAQANVDLLRASVELFRTQIASAEATAKQTAAEAAASQATAERSNADLRRAQELMTNHTISPQEFDTARTVAAAADANLRAAQEKATSDEAKVGQSKAQLEAGIKAYERAEAQSAQAEWDLRAAQLNLSYARVTAPISGHVTKKAVQNGDYIQVGQKLMALVPEELFVTANFKETQLKNIHTNQPVRVSIDSVRDGVFPGHVQSIMAGSGARFSLLPPENAVGNYIKVVQRVPVKIVFDRQPEAGHVLGPGLSVVPSVRTSSSEVPEVALVVAAIVLVLLVGFLWSRAARRRRAGLG